jgi:hypothetical protein
MLRLGRLPEAWRIPLTVMIGGPSSTRSKVFLVSSAEVR